MRQFILFDSKCFKIKSIYRKKAKNGTISQIYLRLEEDQNHYVFYDLDAIEYLENLGLKRGDLITIHYGNGGYHRIEKGNTVPESAVIAYVRPIVHKKVSYKRSKKKRFYVKNGKICTRK